MPSTPSTLKMPWQPKIDRQTCPAHRARQARSAQLGPSQSEHASVSILNLNVAEEACMPPLRTPVCPFPPVTRDTREARGQWTPAQLLWVRTPQGPDCWRWRKYYYSSHTPTSSQADLLNCPRLVPNATRGSLWSETTIQASNPGCATPPHQAHRAR